MTTYFTKEGLLIGVTLVLVGPCTVTQIKTKLNDGYESIQVGFEPTEKRNKPIKKHLEPSKGCFKHLAEFKKLPLSELAVGNQISCDIFEPNEKIKVTSYSKGRGFAGGVKRYGFKGGPKTHGQSDRHRAPGSIGASAYPARVIKGTRMAGHYGCERKTVTGLTVVGVNTDRNLLLIKGAIPGFLNSLVYVEKQEISKNNAN